MRAIPRRCWAVAGLAALFLSLFLVGCGGLKPIKQPRNVALPPYELEVLYDNDVWDEEAYGFVSIVAGTDKLTDEQIHALLKTGYNQFFREYKRKSPYHYRIRSIFVCLFVDLDQVVKLASLSMWDGDKEPRVDRIEQDYINARPTHMESRIYREIEDTFARERIPEDDELRSNAVIQSVGSKYGLSLAEAGEIYMKVDAYVNYPEVYRRHYMKE